MYARIKQCNYGVTLIELLVVFAVISVLAAIIFPVFDSVRQRSDQSSCLSNLHQIGLAINAYAADSDDLYPVDKYTDLFKTAAGGKYWNTVQSMPQIQTVLSPYTRSATVWRCPSDKGFDQVESDGVIPLAAHPSSFDKYGDSYMYRTELGLTHQTLSGVVGTEPAPSTIQHGPSDINVLSDLSGEWHGSIGDVNHRYNVLMGDGRVTSMTQAQFDACWQMQFVPPTGPPSS